MTHLVPLLLSRCFPLAVTIGIFALPATAQPADAPPFAKLGDNVLAAFSTTSWNDHWKTLHADKAPAKILDTLYQDVVPSALKLADATGALEEIPAKLEAFRKSIDWSDLASSRLAGVVWSNPNGMPQITLELTPNSSRTEKVLTDLSKLLAFIAEQSESALAWAPRDTGGALELAGDLSDGTDDLSYAIPIGVLSRTGDHIYLELGLDPQPGKGRKGILPESGMDELWRKCPRGVVSAAAFDFARLVDIQKQLATLEEEEFSEAASSLVLDETIEALFADDLETLEKLKEVDSGFDTLTAMDAPSPLKALLDRVFSLVADQGVLLTTIAPEGDNVVLTTLWKPKPGSEGSKIYEQAPLSDRFLGILGPGMVEVSARGLPDFEAIYRLIKDLVGSYQPQGPMLLEQWAEIQKSIGFNVETDLLPALGRETAWMTQSKESAATFGVPVMTNTMFFALALKDIDAARRSLDKIEEHLGQLGFPVSATKINDIPFSVVETGMVGSFRWTLLPTPPTLVLTTSDPNEYLAEWMARLKESTPHALDYHPRWDEMRSIWSDAPTAVSVYDSAVQWKQQLDALKGSQMLVAMMGPLAGSALPVMRLVIAAMENSEPPSVVFRVDQTQDGIRESRNLLLYGKKKE